MLKFEIIPPYPQLKRNDEYTLFVDSEYLGLGFELFYFSLPESFQNLSACLQELGKICHPRSEIDSLIEPEQIQYFIAQGLMHVELVNKQLLFKSFHPDIYTLYPDIIEFIEPEFEANPILKRIGKVWFAGESLWPYIGYLPHNNQLLLCQSNWGRESNPVIWFNNPIPVETFVDDVSTFLHEFDHTDLKVPLQPVLETLSQLPIILKR